MTSRLAWLLAALLTLSSPALPDELHTPAAGSAERKAIMDALHEEYTTGSGPSVKFLVKQLKVHDGWAWIRVVPLDKSGTPEGEEWPSLLRQSKGQWTIIDLIAIANSIDDPVGPAEPSPGFIKAVRKKYPSLPSDVFP